MRLGNELETFQIKNVCGFGNESILAPLDSSFFRQRRTMVEVKFPTKAIPYVVLAVIASSSSLKQGIKLTSARDVSETSIQIDKRVIVGTASAVRYLLRHAKLLNEQRPECQHEARLVDLILLANIETLSAAVKNRATKYLLGDVPGLVDALAWGVLYKKSPEAEYASGLQVVKEALLLAEECAGSTQLAPVTSIPEIQGTSPETNPLDCFKNLIAAQLSELSGVEARVVYDAIDLPRVLEHGDLAVAVPRLRVKGNPAAFAKQWAESFVPNEYIIEASAIGPFLNFRINAKVLMHRTLQTVGKYGEDYGKNKLGNNKKIVVEYSSPNIAKPFHAGHLRSTIIGSFIANVYRANGWDVTTMNYLGDWGKQYGKLSFFLNKKLC